MVCIWRVRLEQSGHAQDGPLRARRLRYTLASSRVRQLWRCVCGVSKRTPPEAPAARGPRLVAPPGTLRTRLLRSRFRYRDTRRNAGRALQKIPPNPLHRRCFWWAIRTISCECILSPKHASIAEFPTNCSSLRADSRQLRPSQNPGRRSISAQAGSGPRVELCAGSARKIRIPFVSLSTDRVFDGIKKETTSRAMCRTNSPFADAERGRSSQLSVGTHSAHRSAFSHPALRDRVANRIEDSAEGQTIVLRHDRTFSPTYVPDLVHHCSRPA